MLKEINYVHKNNTLHSFNLSSAIDTYISPKKKTL